MRLTDAIARVPLVASVQASPGSTLEDPVHLAALARASRSAGVEALRLEGIDAIHAVVEATQLPAIGLIKRHFVGCDVYITPTLEDVARLAETPCEAIAFDATGRLRPDASTTAEIVGAIHRRGRLAVADCDTSEAGRAAIEAGADLLTTTLAGYTEATRELDDRAPALDTLREFVTLPIPVLAEGRYKEPWQVQAALKIGAKAVVVGGALNDPVKQTRDFLASIPRAAPVLAFDIGGTWIRAARFDGWRVQEEWRERLPGVQEERERWILERVRDQRSAIERVAISTGGTVDPHSLTVVEANQLIPGLAGRSLAIPGIEVVALNDGLATAWAHACLPPYAGRRVATLALGTGVGFGFVADGKILMGPRGEYPRLNDVTGPEGASFEDVLGGRSQAQRPARIEAARRIVAAIEGLFAPDEVILAGGVGLNEDLGLDLPTSPFGDQAGLFGAAALALYPPPNLRGVRQGSL